MTSQINHITVDCADTYKLASFWSQVTGRPMHDDDNPGDPEAILLAPDGIGPNILFIAVPEGKAAKNRLHLDLMPVDRTRDEEVERLLGIGATVVGDHRTSDGKGWVTLADPEGNEFCVERSAAERVSA
ncbi:glyoxalase [Rhizocola hellebori]|uniref:Glyoxalase n=1 Tax=Rhizocola hellebori TaxID=1392758 RepID=A0A8J3QHP5_9ACTN|nr:VOC family protein [Rhizocola hellebori]GIH11070.1 glyoxalase [Rhizocola hellebori]